MTSATKKKLIQTATNVLQANDLGSSTKPSPNLYPHQWFWDSCFIAIGLRWLDIERAKTELRSLVKGQWKNGMFPHIIFSESDEYHFGPKKWRSHSYPDSPDNIETSTMTQPPVFGEAIVRVGELLSEKDRLAWYEEMYQPLLNYHQWLYTQRDPYNRGLISLLHPWESGLDNTPPWMRVLTNYTPKRVKALELLHIEYMLNYLRKDTKHVSADERPSPSDLFTLYHLADDLRRLKYDVQTVIKSRLPLVEDVFFNALALRSNQHLSNIAKNLGRTLPVDLQRKFVLAQHSFEHLKDSGNFWSRNAYNGKLIKEPSVGTFLSLYAGFGSGVDIALIKGSPWWPVYGVATTPMTSAFFKPRNYWQGPVWLSTNWLIIDGLKRVQKHRLARELQQSTLDMVAAQNGMFEYYSPLDGSPAGTPSFSWTSALVIDLLNSA